MVVKGVTEGNGEGDVLVRSVQHQVNKLQLAGRSRSVEEAHVHKAPEIQQERLHEK